MFDLEGRLEDSLLDKDRIEKLKNLIKSQEYSDKNDNLYMLLYIENYEI